MLTWRHAVDSDILVFLGCGTGKLNDGSLACAVCGVTRSAELAKYTRCRYLQEERISLVCQLNSL